MADSFESKLIPQSLLVDIMQQHLPGNQMFSKSGFELDRVWPRGLRRRLGPWCLRIMAEEGYYLVKVSPSAGSNRH